MGEGPAERRRVGRVFQSYALLPHLNVWDNLELGLRMRGGNASARDERIRNVLEVLQLSEQAQQKPSQLSGGQRQRVALARALANSPSLDGFSEENLKALFAGYGPGVISAVEELLAQLHRVQGEPMGSSRRSSGRMPVIPPFWAGSRFICGRPMNWAT